MTGCLIGSLFGPPEYHWNPETCSGLFLLGLICCVSCSTVAWVLAVGDPKVEKAIFAKLTPASGQHTINEANCYYDHTPVHLSN